MKSTAIKGKDGKFYPVITFKDRRYVSPRPFDEFNKAAQWAYARLEAILDAAYERLVGWDHNPEA